MDARPIQEHSNEPPEGGAIDACANVALGGGTLVRLDAEGASRTEDGDHRRFEPRRRGPLTAEIDGFNLQAAVRIEATDDEGRERLARYCARPAFALERLSVLPDGRIAYEVKYPSRRATHRSAPSCPVHRIQMHEQRAQPVQRPPLHRSWTEAQCRLQASPSSHWTGRAAAT